MVRQTRVAPRRGGRDTMIVKKRTRVLARMASLADRRAHVAAGARSASAVEREYAAIEHSIHAQDIEKTEVALREHFAGLRATADKTGAQQRRRVATLQEKRRELLHLKYEEAIPLDLFREEQSRLTREIEVAENILNSISAEFQQSEDVLLEAVEFSRGVEDVYLRAAGDPELRRMLNQLFFDRIEVEVEGGVHATLAAPFADIRAGRIVETVKGAISAFQEWLKTANPSHLLDGQGSNWMQMVGTAGLEPATSRV